MTQFLLIVIFISAALSLLSYVYCWNDIRGGRPHIISLRQITTIMDRARLNKWFGVPQPGYYYQLTPEQVQGVQHRRRWFVYSECAADIVCLFGAWWFANNASDEMSLYWFIALAGLCQALNLAYSFWLMRKWKDQIREELENTDD